MKEFKAKKGNFWIFIVLLSIIPIFFMWILWLDSDMFFNNPTKWILLILSSLLPFVLFIWIYFSTKYAIIKEDFHYQSAFLKGKIPVSKIKKIQKNKTLWSGVKPAMTTKGLIIKYGYDEIYIAPEDNEALIKELLAVNPDIIIEN